MELELSKQPKKKQKSKKTRRGQIQNILPLLGRLFEFITGIGVCIFPLFAVHPLYIALCIFFAIFLAFGFLEISHKNTLKAQSESFDSAYDGMIKFCNESLNDVAFAIATAKDSSSNEILDTNINRTVYKIVNGLERIVSCNDNNLSITVYCSTDDIGECFRIYTLSENCHQHRKHIVCEGLNIEVFEKDSTAFAYLLQENHPKCYCASDLLSTNDFKCELPENEWKNAFRSILVIPITLTDFGNIHKNRISGFLWLASSDIQENWVISKVEETREYILGSIVAKWINELLLVRQNNAGRIRKKEMRKKSTPSK